ncbi:hypothetical protein JW916_06715 [Candidatus Sumerlaeota bacterium]|nr:hypothetical protein [Candidatus Sumerlaeota bacterium]
MSKKNASILFLGKEADEYCEKALEFCRLHFTNVTACLGKWGDPKPDTMTSWRGDYVVSYLSRWIVPSGLLELARVAAINFHPGPPEYPGFGCYNFALYENAREYGVTCHRMVARVDAGPIVAVRRFPILPSDGVASLLNRTHENLFALFLDVATGIAEGRDLPASTEQWKREPFTKKRLLELERITPEMTREEVERRIRAVSFHAWRPFVEVQGFRFDLRTEQDE